MGNLFRKGGWLTSLLTLFLMPVFLVTLLGVIMARFQVKGEFDRYQAIREYTSLAALSSATKGEVVMVRGRIAAGPSLAEADGLVVFQERPLAGRETRFQEEFPLVFPSFTLQLTDGALLVQPGNAQVIAHEIHRVVDKPQDREYTGFQVGDVVTIQGKWEKPASSAKAVLPTATGITSLDRAGVMAESEGAFRRLDSVAVVLGLLTILTSIPLLMQLLRDRSPKKIVSPVSV